MAKKNADFQTTVRERVTFPLYGTGQNIAYTFVTSYLMLFYTDYLFIPAYVVSAMLLFTKAWDAINDPLFGMIVDRTNMKSGKFKPWLRIATFAIPVTTLLIFLVPSGLSLAWRITLAILTYFIWDISYTLSDVPLFSTLTAITGNVNERTALIGYNGISGIVGTIIISIILVPQIEKIGFGTVAAVVAALSFSGLIVFPFVARERNRVNAAPAEKFKLRDVIAYIRGNKYLLYFYAFVCIYGTFSVPLSTYVMIQCLGSLSYVAYYTAAALPFLLVLFLVIPKITKKIDRMRLFKILMIILIALGIAMYLAGYSSPIVYGIFWVARNVVFMGAAMMALTFASDFVEYGNYITGMRKEGITFAAQTFATKFMGAASSALAGVVLGLIGYNGALKVQSPETIQWIWNASNGVPIIGILLGLPLLFKCNFKSADIQIMSDINAGRISREEGEARLSRKYKSDATLLQDGGVDI